jgi:hypothetical protein
MTPIKPNIRRTPKRIATQMYQAERRLSELPASFSLSSLGDVAFPVLLPAVSFKFVLLPLDVKLDVTLRNLKDS